MSFIFGKSGSAPSAFRGPGYKEQGELLNSLFMGNVLASNPQYTAGLDSQIAALNQQISGMQQNAPQQSTQNYGHFNRWTGEYTGVNPQNDPYAIYQKNLGGLQSQLAELERSRAQAQAYQSNQAQQQLSPLQFQQRQPYQFSQLDIPQVQFDPNKAVGDAFTPQAQAIRNVLGDQEQQRIKYFNEDVNKRGLYQSGAALGGINDITKNTDQALSNALLNLAGQQASQQLGANQFAANLQAQQNQFRANADFQREVNQAAEIFRQQGATDQQAQLMAQDAMQRRAFENQIQRQPLEDLLRLYSFSTGANPGTPAQPGLLQSLAPVAGAAIGGFFGGGK